MTVRDIAQRLQAQICEVVNVTRAEDGLHHVTMPLAFADGDLPVVALVHDGERWILSDLGNTLVRFGYEDLYERLDRGDLLTATLSLAGVNRRNDELTKPLVVEQGADAVFDFINALLRIDDLARRSVFRSAIDDPEPTLSRIEGPMRFSFAELPYDLDFDRVRSTVPAPPTAVPNRRRQFRTEVLEAIEGLIPPGRMLRNWYDSRWDRNRDYRVDFRINGMSSPLFLHALSNNNNARDATITIYRFKQEQVDGRHVAIYRDEQSTNDKVRMKLNEVCEQSFVNFEREKPSIRRFLQSETQAGDAARLT